MRVGAYPWHKSIRSRSLVVLEHNILIVVGHKVPEFGIVARYPALLQTGASDRVLAHIWHKLLEHQRRDLMAAPHAVVAATDAAGGNRPLDQQHGHAADVRVHDERVSCGGYCGHFWGVLGCGGFRCISGVRFSNDFRFSHSHSHQDSLVKISAHSCQCSVQIFPLITSLDSRFLSIKRTHTISLGFACVIFHHYSRCTSVPKIQCACVICMGRCGVFTVALHSTNYPLQWLGGTSAAYWADTKAVKRRWHHDNATTTTTTTRRRQRRRRTGMDRKVRRASQAITATTRQTTTSSSAQTLWSSCAGRDLYVTSRRRDFVANCTVKGRKKLAAAAWKRLLQHLLRVLENNTFRAFGFGAIAKCVTKRADDNYHARKCLVIWPAAGHNCYYTQRHKVSECELEFSNGSARADSLLPLHIIVNR